MLKLLKYSDNVAGLLKYGDDVLNVTKTIAKESIEKVNKQMLKLIKR